MIDYKQLRETVLAQKRELTQRKEQIVDQKKSLDEESEKIRRELIGLDQILEGLDVTLGNLTEVETPGLTDHIRQILRQTNVPLVPTQIRDELVEAGVTGSSPKNLLINIHTVLGRIEDELDKAQNDADGKFAYIAKQAPQRISMFAPPRARR